MATSPAQPAEGTDAKEQSQDHVRLNAIHHGLFAHDIVLPDESRDGFEQAAKILKSRYNPQNAEELELLQALQETWWRLERAIVNERNLHVLTEQQQLANVDALFGEQDEPARRALAQAAGFQANFRIFDQLGRHIARLDRMIASIRRELETRIAHRQAAELEKMTEQSQPDPQSAAQMPNFTGSLKDFKRKQWLRQQEKLHHTPSNG